VEMQIGKQASFKDLKDPSNTIESISEKYGVSVEFI